MNQASKQIGIDEAGRGATMFPEEHHRVFARQQYIPARSGWERTAMPETWLGILGKIMAGMLVGAGILMLVV